MKYDNYTRQIMKKVLSNDSNCIDIGSHKGEFLIEILKHAPKGLHYAFEPIPNLFEGLKDHFNQQVKIFPIALSRKKGKSIFYFVTNAPAYSGLKQRHYDRKNPKIKEIDVELNTPDEVISMDNKIDLIKIDVEGGEFDVLKGGKN